MLKHFRSFTIGFLMVALATSSMGQTTFPTHAVRIIVPFPPGGASDAMTRIIAAKLNEMWNQPVIVENRPGAGTIIGTETVARSAADGHTMGLVITAHVINPAIGKTLPYDTLRDFSAVSQLAVVHQAVFARNDLPVNSVQDLIDYSKANPGRVSFGTAGAGTAGHLLGELFNQKTGASLLHVAYKGSAPAQADLLGGHLDLIIDALSAQNAMAEAGKIKLIALASPQRHPNLSHIPTIAESTPGISVESFFGMVVPSAVPRFLVLRLNNDLVSALRDPTVRQRILDLGLVPVGSTPDEFTVLIQTEIKKWTALLKTVTLKLD